MTDISPQLFLSATLVSATISIALIFILRPLLVRYAPARPNARSSHRVPTPQGGGIAVIAATTLVTAAAVLLTPPLAGDPLRLALILACAIALAVLGVADDIQPMEALPRLLLQGIAVLVALAALPPQLHLFSVVPWWIERALLFVAVLWFVNLVNFMDGIDWMTIAEVVPVTAALALFGLLGALPGDATCMAIALCGAMLGFAPFNRPVARLFLGDVGSLPIGLLLGWLLILLADKHLAAALLLPLYYLADATITLLRRLAAGEPVWQAHRRHFYQRALDGGLGVYQIVGWVFLVNMALVGLALLTVFKATLVAQLVSLALGALLVGALLLSFNCVKKSKF
jgi:UDP-N-acetylmuramyl pentapeptide phosphotransferase/UDP-N-acetylglucosamine-1-phosphate transferase